MGDGRFKGHVLEPLLSRGPAIMGVVNVTPDSFSDGGEFYNKNKAIEHGLRLVQEGADTLDIGGESTRPGAEVVEIQEEIDRVCPVIEGLVGKADYISIDTRNAATMREAIKCGANIINDISALTYDPESITVAAGCDLPIVAMHSQGTPQDMQLNPQYDSIVTDIIEYFEDQVNRYKTYRIDEKRIVIDPGIGFGKTLEHNLQILGNIKEICDIGVPVLLGTSRKSFIEKIDTSADESQRIGGSLSSALWGVSQGCAMVRVHDVRETAQALKIYRAISEVGSDGSKMTRLRDTADLSSSGTS